MSVEILLPKLGLTMEEAEIIEWCKQEGDPVSSGEVIYVLATEKTIFEFEAPQDGILGPILVPAGESTTVGGVVAYLLEPGEKQEDFQVTTPPGNPGKRPEDSEKSILCNSEDSPSGVSANSGAELRATPRAKKLARSAEIALSTIQGSGPSGRIVAEDVNQAEREKLAASTNKNASTVADKLVRFSAMRKTIAKNMMASKLETAQTYMSISLDASAIVKAQKVFSPMIEKRYSARLTLTDIFMKICANAILSHPIINTRWTEKGIQYLADVHMGMAMAVDDGLLVPVIRDINQKDLTEVALDRIRLITLCRGKEFSLGDISGSTFTLSTLGAFGIESFTSNINRPESAILAVGAVKDSAVVVDGEIRVLPTANITLTYDHRHIDGAEAAKFMKTLKSQLEAPEGPLR